MSLVVHIRKKIKNFTLTADFETKDSSLGILGASGCGKSMTLKCIAGIVTPDEGYIELNGKVLFDSEDNINVIPQQRRVGYLFQNYALFPNMTVSGNIGIGIKGTKAEKARQVAEMIKNFHLKGLEDRYPGQLSGGQQQRAALARILAYEPDVLLLDEPFSALDSYLKEELQFQLQNLLREYQGDSILVTHSRDEAYRLCKNLIILDNGRILEAGETKRVFAKPKKVQVARLTGCKNFSRAVKVSENQVEALDWGQVLTVQAPIPEALSHIGIRAHDFKACHEPEHGENVLPCDILRITEAPFEWNMLVQTGNDEENRENEHKSGSGYLKVVLDQENPADTDKTLIWWKVGKNQINSGFQERMPRYLMVEPGDILLLEV